MELKEKQCHEEPRGKSGIKTHKQKLFISKFSNFLENICFSTTVKVRKECLISTSSLKAWYILPLPYTFPLR